MIGEGSQMHEPLSGERSVEELEAVILRAIESYFEARRREVEGSKATAGPAFEAYEQTRQHLANVEGELEAIRHRTDELRAATVDAASGDSEASELQKEVSELHVEIQDLAEAEMSALKRKEEAEETLRLAKLRFEGDLGLAGEGVAAVALRKAEEIDNFKERLDQHFAKGRTSVLETAT